MLGSYSPVVGQSGNLQTLASISQQQSAASNSTPQSMPALAPMPSVNAWNKPISFAAVAVSGIPVSAGSEIINPKAWISRNFYFLNNKLERT